MHKEKNIQGESGSRPLAAKAQDMKDNNDSVARVDSAFTIRELTPGFITDFAAINGITMNAAQEMDGNTMLTNLGIDSAVMVSFFDQSPTPNFQSISYYYKGHTLRLEPEIDDNQKVTGMVIRLLKEDFEKEKRKFRELLEHSSHAVLLLSEEGKSLYASPPTEQLLGYTSEETLQLEIGTMVHQDDSPYIWEVMENAILNPYIPIKGRAVRLRYQNGTYRWHDSTLVNLLHHPGVQAVVCHIRDVNEEMEHEIKRARGEQQNREALEHARIGTWELDLNTSLISRNPMCNQIFGYVEKDELWTPQMLFDHVCPTDRHRFQEFFWEALTCEESEIDIQLCGLTGNVHQVGITTRLIKNATGKPEKLFGTIMEIRGPKAAEKSSQLTREHIGKIMDHLEEGLIISDKEGKIIYWNQASLKLHGFESVSQSPTSFHDFLKHFRLYFPGGDLMPIRKWPFNRLLDNKSLGQSDIKIKSLKHGWEKVFSYKGNSLQDNDRDYIFFLTVLDITNTRRARIDMKLGEEKFMDTFHHSQVALLIARKRDGICLEMNKSAEVLLGYTFEEYAGHKVLSLNTLPGLNVDHYLDKLLAGNQDLEVEIPIATNVGILLNLSCSAKQIILDNEPCLLYAIGDISKPSSLLPK